jgi:hypothetical protein
MNRTVLITGAAVRLGCVMADTLARAGWNVVVHANRSTTSAQALCLRLAAFGGHAWPVAGDLLAADGPERVFNAALASAGHVDALVNNASQFARQPLAAATSGDFERLWRINTLAPVRLTQLLAAHLADRHATGCVVNLLDQRIAYPNAGALPYLLSKKALEAFTFSSALELAPAVRINAVAPGAVLMPTGEESKEPAGTFPLNRSPSAEQVADAVRYLLEAPAVTGQILYVDSGQHLSSF